MKRDIDLIEKIRLESLVKATNKKVKLNQRLLYTGSSTPTEPFLLQENGFFLLQENGFKIKI